MTIEELNKLIKEELDSYLNENEEEEVDAEGGDDIEVTTDEPAEEDDALDTLRQIYDMLKPLVEPEDEEEPEMDMEEPEGEEEGEEESLDEGINESLYVTPEEINYSIELAKSLGFDDIKSFHQALMMATGPVFLSVVLLLQLAQSGVSAVIPKLKTTLKGLKANPSRRDIPSSVGLDEEEETDSKAPSTPEELAAAVNKKLMKLTRVRETVGYPNYKADQVQKVKADADDVNQSLNESVDATARFKKLANIK